MQFRKSHDAFQKQRSLLGILEFLCTQTWKRCEKRYLVLCAENGHRSDINWRNPDGHVTFLEKLQELVNADSRSSKTHVSGDLKPAIGERGH